ncbi:Y-family DNA polymerase [bacterium]|nr:Y-family DNA polymerase [bacterium]
MNVYALVDCDSFFVSCEQKMNPELKNKPVCVLSNKDGCVISRSKEAKRMGVRMGQPYFMAKHEFPNAIYVSCHHDLYGEISEQVMNLLREFSPKVQVYSVDEAFVDLTGLKRLYKKNYLELAEYIREQIKERLDIPVSIGVSSTKTLAKLASDKAKKEENGVYLIGKQKISSVLEKTPVEEIWGIGRNLSLLCKRSGILSAADLVKKDDVWLDKKFGIRGREMKHELLGEIVSTIVNEEKLPKSIQKTSAFGLFTSDLDYIKNQLNYHIHSACRKLRKIDCKSKVIGVMLRTKDFKVYYSKKILPVPTSFEMEISDIAFDLLNEIHNPNISYRSTGIILDDLICNSEEQLFLFSNDINKEKSEKLSQCFDKLESKFGKNIVQIGFIED